MTAVILQIVVGLGGLLTLWAKDYFSSNSVAARQKEAENEEIQKGRTNLDSGNVDAVIVRLDGVLDAETSASSGNAGISDSIPESGSSDTVRRLDNFGICNG